MATPPLINPRSWHIEVGKTRKDRRITQREMERRTGIHQSRLSRIENGLVDPKVSDAIQMARAVGLEFALVPKRTLPILYGLLRSNSGDGPRASGVELLVGKGDDA